MAQNSRKKVSTVNISLPIETLNYLHEKIEEGAYSSVSEVIRDGLRLLKRTEILDGRVGQQFDRKKVAEALDGLKKLSQHQSLGSEITIKELIESGRS